MAIAFDAATGPTKTVAGAPNPLTFVHTCTGTNLILFVGVTDQSGVTNNITSVTYNGVSATKIDEQQNGVGDGDTYLYYLIAPATGLNTLSVTRTNTANDMIIYAASYTGAKQSGQPDASSKGASTGTASQAVTSIADNCWAVLCWYSRGDTSSAGSGTTLRTNATNQGGMFDNNTAKTPAGSITLNVTQGGAESNSRVMASFAPFVVVNNARLLTLLGVGT